MSRKLILGSSSPYRKQLLQRLGLPFHCISPDIDEQILDGETPQQLVQRLSKAKAEEVAKSESDAIIIASDQVAILDGLVVGKPHTHENAIKQLSDASGRRVEFNTGLCVLDSHNRKSVVEMASFAVQFRTLSLEEIDAYLKKDQPYNCAGSFRCESLGVALFTRMEGDDPNALMGLPLIRLVAILKDFGLDVLG